MRYAMVAACVSMYLICVVGCWRIAEYFCMKKRWILLLPGANLIYFSWLADVVAVEAHDSKNSRCRFLVSVLMLLLLASVFVTYVHQYELVHLAGRIAFILSAIFTILSLCWCYMIILSNSFDYPCLVCLASLIIPFPIWLFIASFTIKGKIEEVVALYWGP